MVKKHKSPMQAGLEMLLNDPRVSPFTPDGARGFKELISATNQPLTETLRYLGKNARKPSQKKQDEERSARRVENLEESTEEK